MANEVLDVRAVVPGDRSVSSTEFYNTPAVKGASQFAHEFTGLSMPDVKELGHQFRMFQSDPVAEQLERHRQSLGDVIPELVVDAINFLPVCFLEIGMRQVRAVCKIDTEGTDFEGRRGTWSGTGFLVGRNLLLTNHHVLHDIAAAANAWCIFNFQLGVEYTPLDTVGFRLDPKRLFVTSPLRDGLDYTFVWIEAAASEQFGTVVMRRSAFTVHPGDFANVVQHPRGRLKELVLQDNQVMQDTGLMLHYASDTEGGSSGSPAFNNRWELIALHHASKRNAANLTINPKLPPPAYVNEGVKLSAIAADLERRVQMGETHARTVLESFHGVDSLMGFFGGLGRHSGGASSLECLRNIYSGDNEDIDVGFWNIDRFTTHDQEQLEAVATIVADLNLDVWSFAQASPAACRALVKVLNERYKLPYEAAFTDPNAAGDQRSMGLIWNTQTIEGTRIPWPADVEEWFDVRSTQFAELMLESVQGKVFDNYPGVFKFVAKGRPSGAAPFALFLVPLQLEQVSEGSLRRRTAAKILAAAIKKAIAAGARGDWMIGGDFNVQLATADFQKMLGPDLTALGAEDEGAGMVAYLKNPTSLVNHIFVCR